MEYNYLIDLLDPDYINYQEIEGSSDLCLVQLLPNQKQQIKQKAYRETLKAFRGIKPADDEPSANWAHLLQMNEVFIKFAAIARDSENLHNILFDNYQQVEQLYDYSEVQEILSNYHLLQYSHPMYQNIDFSQQFVLQHIFDNIKQLGISNDFYFQWQYYCSCHNVKDIFGKTANLLYEEQWLVYHAMQQYKQDQENPKNIQDREKKMRQLTPQKKDYSVMTPDIMASFHNTKLEKLLGDVASPHMHGISK